MNIEEKNKWVIQYVNTLAKQINEQYNNIVKQEHIDSVISMHKNSDKDIETIKEEIDKMAKEFIENYLKRMQEIKDDMIEKLKNIYDREVKYILEGQKIFKEYGINSSHFQEHLQKTKMINKENLIEVDNIIQKNGWIGSNIDDIKAKQAMWLTIQHADLSTQLKYYPLVEEAVKQNKESLEHLHELEDKILINQGKNQKYGTQYRLDENINDLDNTFIATFPNQNVLYHGSFMQGIKRLEPKESTHGNYVYATNNKDLATIFSARCGNDNTYALYSTNKNGPWIIVERIPYGFETMFNNSSSIYTLDGKTFKDINTGFSELVSDVAVDIINEEHIDNVYNKLKELEQQGKIQMYTYQNKPSKIPYDNSDLIEKELKQLERRNKELSEHTFDNLLYYHPYLMDKINNKLKENNIPFQYNKKKLVDLFENRVIRSELKPEEEQFIKSSYMNMINTYPELTQELNEKMKFSQKTNEEKVSRVIEKLNIPEIKDRYINDNRDFKTIGNELINNYKEKEFYINEESKFKKTEDELKKTSNNYLSKFENCDIESLKKLDIIYTYNKINTAINMTPKGEKDKNKINEEIEKGKKYLFKQIKDVYNIEKIDDLHSFISKIKDAESKKTDSAYNILMQYKNDLKKTYKDNKGDVKIILPTQNLKEINAAKHRENQFFNEIVDGVYSVGSYEGMMAYITRANAGSMMANKDSITLPKNPFDLNKSNNQVLSLQKPVSIYSSSVDNFEPVVDFSLTKDNKINLRFDNEWISREKSVKCSEQVVNNMPSSVLDKRNIIVKDNNQSINIKEQIINKKTSQEQTKNKESKPIPKQPSIPLKRQEEKQVKKSQPVKMNNFEKKAYPPLKQKQEIKKQAKQQVNNKSNVKTLKNTYKGTSSKSGSGTSGNVSKGFVNIILGSIIAIVLGIILFIIIK